MVASMMLSRAVVYVRGGMLRCPVVALAVGDESAGGAATAPLLCSSGCTSA